MPSPSVTYTFANSTTADATQVNQNFTDVINGITDGTKDLSISALTAAGAATFNGNVTLGNSSSDDLTITGSLASTIPIKTTATYNIGSATLGLLGIYIGGTVSFTTCIKTAATATWTLTLPATAGSTGDVLKNTGSGSTTWSAPSRSPTDAQNYSIGCSVAGSALTITMNAADGNAPSSTNPVDIVFRNATSATGTPVTRQLTSAPSVTVTSGATLGHSSGSDVYIYVYALDNAGTVELAVSSIWRDELSIGSTSAISNAADDSGFYATANRTDVAFRLVGRLKYSTAPNGTYSATPDEISLLTGHLAFPKVEYKSAVLSANTSTATSDTFVDATGASLTLSPGTWDIWFDGSYTVEAVGAGTITGEIRITDSADTVVGNARRFIKDADLAAGSDRAYAICLTAPNISVTTTTTYKVRLRCNNSSATSKVTINGAVDQTGGLAGNDNASVLYAKRVQ